MNIKKTQKLFLVICMTFSIIFLACGCEGNAGTNPIKETQSADDAEELNKDAVNQNEEAIKQEEVFDSTYFYNDVLAQYKDMVQNDFYMELLGTDSYDSSFGEDIGFEIRTRKQNLYYALYDLDGNGTEELIIAGGDDGSPWNYDLYGLDGSKIVHIFPEMSFGYRNNFSIYENGVIEVYYTDSAAESGVDFYKIADDGFNAELMDFFAMAGELVGEQAVFTYYHNENEITEEQYNAYIQNYEIPLAIALDWVEIL